MNDTIKDNAVEEIVESEEVVEIALANSEEGNTDSEAPFEMSGLTEKQKRRKEIYDKITTGILIALLCSPIAIVLYIFLWFILKP